MNRVRHQDMAAFSRGLETLYGADGMASLPGRITSCLDGLFGCELATFDLVDLAAVRWNALVASTALPDWELLIAALQRCAHDHPILSHATEHRYSHAIRISDLRSLRQYRQSEIYHELFVPYVFGMDRQLGFVAKPSATLAFGASVNRRGRDFSVEQRTLMEMLRPHLLQAHSLARNHELILEREQSLREEMSAAIGGGICQMDAKGNVEWMTGSAETLLVRYFPAWRGEAKTLPAELRQRLRASFAGKKGGANRPAALGMTWYFPGAPGTLKVEVAGRDALGSWRLLFTERQNELSAEMLARRHNLSKREGEVLFWIGQSKSNEEIGMILSISVRTVGKHIEHLFEKLQVYNRTAAARCALGR